MTDFTQNLRLVLPNFNVTGWHDQVNTNFETIDAVITASTGITGVVGAWDNDTDYFVGNKVVDSDIDTAYRCLVEHTSSATGSFADDRLLHPDYWVIVEVGVSVRGEWELGATYYPGDIVYDVAENVVAMAELEHIAANLRLDAIAGNWTFVADLKAAVDAANAAAAIAVEAAENASGAVSGELGPAIAGSPSKTTPVGADKFAITDSANAQALAHVTYTNLLATLQDVNDALYAEIVHTHDIIDVTNLQDALDDKAPINAPTFTGTVTLPGDPASPLQAAPKQYVDAAVLGLGNRTTVRAATTANITISTALNNNDILDGVTLATGDYVLVKNQTTQSQNGIYVVGVTPARAVEFDTWNELIGALTTVQEGTVNADTIWLNTSNKGGTLGSSNVVYQQMSVVGELKAVNNLSDVGNAATSFDNIKQPASATATGVVELATSAEVQAGTDTTRAVTTAALVARTATETRTGLVELATTAEAAAGTDGNRAVTAAGVAAAISALGFEGSITLLGSVSESGGSTFALTGLAGGSYKFFLVVLSGLSGNASQVYSIALSSNNGSSYGTNRTVTPSTNAGAAAGGWVLVSRTNATGSKLILPIAYETDGDMYTTPATENVITGVINAIRISASSGSFDGGTMWVYGFN